jgi:uncharacterized membrane protein YhaH (DUF805 family)
MTFFEAVKFNFVHYADFKGRAPRSQYWWWFLFVLLTTAILNTIDSAAGWDVINVPDFNGQEVPTQIYGGGVLSSIWFFALLIPNLAVAVRRLHDTGKSGWWLLLNLVCCIATIILLIWYILPGNKGENRFGPDPLASS